MTRTSQMWNMGSDKDVCCFNPAFSGQFKPWVWNNRLQVNKDTNEHHKIVEETWEWNQREKLFKLKAILSSLKLCCQFLYNLQFIHIILYVNKCFLNIKHVFNISVSIFSFCAVWVSGLGFGLQDVVLWTCSTETSPNEEMSYGISNKLYMSP